MNSLNLMIVAGEASGDAHAAALVCALREAAPDSQLNFFGSTGAQMRAAQVDSIVNADQLAILGLWEVGRALPKFWDAFRELKSAARDRNPAAAVLVDWPDFNLRLARWLHRRGDGSVRFRHVIEPYVTYRRIAGIDDFNEILRFDYVDAIADTNEVEYGISNRFYTRRSTETVGQKAERVARGKKSPLATQPYEALTITIRGKYFFDPLFGGALTPGRRNQFYPIDTFSGFSYGAVPRKFSPLNVDVRYRPSEHLLADFRSDVDTRGGGMRAMSATFGLNRSLVQAFSTFYYTRAIELVPALQQFADARGKEPGTLRGSQWSPSVFLGNREKGLFGGLSLFFDFQKHSFAGSNRALISSTATIGYTWDCCSVTAQQSTWNVGLRNENRVVFAFRLNGIGTFGTEKIGQRFP